MNNTCLNKNNIIFDLDGTLLDTSEGILESVIYTIKKLNLEMLPVNSLQTFIGPPVQISFTEKYGMNSDEAQKAADIFRDYYKSEALLKAKPYSDIYDTLDHLLNHGKRLAVATYKREDYALQVLKHFGCDKYCVVMHGADNLNQLKKKDIILKCIHEMSGSISDSVYIGDTKHDALGAQEAGIDFIGVTYGFGFKNKADVDEYQNVGCATNAEEIMNNIIGSSHEK